MPEPVHPGDLPPDVSPEYAEAYRRAYERALADGDPEDAEHTQRLEGLDGLLSEPPRRERSHDSGPSHRDDDHQRGRPGWLVPALLAGMVVLLLAAAYGVGAFFSSSVDSGTSTEEPAGVVLGDGESGSAQSDDAAPSASPEQDSATKYDGRTEAATITGAEASCEAPASHDAAGNPVRYEPANAFDGDLTTAWRCTGDGEGETLTLFLGDSVEIGELGIVPGYAKTDPRNGVDRYAENNRITEVRWTFSDGSSVVQELDGSATNRDLQTTAIPLTEADQVTLEVLASTPGPRNTIAVSEVRIGAAAQ